jgi:hypothetical protein
LAGDEGLPPDGPEHEFRAVVIESGRTTSAEVGTIAASIAAAGGQLEVVANFNGSRVVIA